MRLRRTLLAVPVAAALPLLAPSAAQADESHQIRLEQLNDSGASGTATVEVSGDAMTVSIDASGLVPNAPHAQHLHGSADDDTDFHCPSASADRDGDGVVSTVEGLPAYGDVFISLTTKGDTSKKSGLALDRFPTADAEGNLSYQRTIQLPDGVADKIRNLHVVQHGIDTNGNGKYDLESLGESPLAKSAGLEDVPLEGTAPANCGMIHGAAAGAVPAGGVETGHGSTHGPDSLALYAVGGLALTGAAGA
ncbi:MAG: hypothetical protein ACRDPT_11130, partial [Streptomycetales bacterium]